MLLILKMGQLLSVGFEQILILYSPSVYNVADVLDTYVYRTGLTMGRFSYAAAAGVFKSVVGLFMIIFANWLSKKVKGSGLW